MSASPLPVPNASPPGDLGQLRAGRATARGAEGGGAARSKLAAVGWFAARMGYHGRISLVASVYICEQWPALEEDIAVGTNLLTPTPEDVAALDATLTDNDWRLV